MSSKQVMVILGSTRPGRLSPAVGAWLVDKTRALCAEYDVAVDLVDLGALDLPLLDEPEHPSARTYVHEHTRAWSARVDAADAFVIVTPEYNFSMPAAVKNALDYLYHEWSWKPVGFVSYGNMSSGTRSVQMIKQVVTTLRMVPIGATVALRLADSVHDGEVSPTVAAAEQARGLMTELVLVASALGTLRRTLTLRDSAALPGLGPTPTVDAAWRLHVYEADQGDAAELLVLQRCCWVDEAIANQTLALPALHESRGDVERWFTDWRVWAVRDDDGRLVGAVRAREEGTVWSIARLMISPEHRGRGSGARLLRFAEQQAPDAVAEYTLHTGQHSTRNLEIYHRAGYRSDPTNDGDVTLRKRKAS